MNSRQQWQHGWLWRASKRPHYALAPDPASVLAGWRHRGCDTPGAVA